MQLQLDLLSHVHYIDREPPVLRCCSANRRASSQRSLRPDPTPQLPYRSDACKARAYSTFSSAACASARDLQSLGDNCKLTRHRQRSASALQGFGGAGLPNGDSSGFGGGNGNGKPLPTQGDMLVNPGESTIAVADRADESDALKSSDLDYLSELIAMQDDMPKNIAFFGSRNMGFMHQQLIEVLSYAMVLTGNHLYTSGATGTNAAVVRGALKARRPDLLTVVLPQSLEMQPEESRTLLKDVQNVISKPEGDHLSLLEASRICNKDIVSRVKQVICFAFHDSGLLLETCKEASEARRVVALFYLD